MKEKPDNVKAYYLLFTDCLLQRIEEFQITNSSLWKSKLLILKSKWLLDTQKSSTNRYFHKKSTLESL